MNERPAHLKGAKEIARVFGVTCKTVARWTREGAPILQIGRKYQASYDDLWKWLKRRYAPDDERAQN